MSSAGPERSGEAARQSVRELLGLRSDPAVRIVELDSPTVGERPLRLNSRFTVIADLDERAKGSLGRTVQWLYGAAADPALAGTVLSDGSCRALHEPPGVADGQRAGAAAIFSDHNDAIGANSIAWADPEDLAAVVSALETAIQLTSAELRGADLVAREQRARSLPASGEVLDLTDHGEHDSHDAHDPDDELDAAIAALDRTEARPDLFEELEVLLGERGVTAPNVADDSAIEQFSAAIERLLPTDSTATRNELVRQLDTARAVREAHLRDSDHRVEQIVAILDSLGVDSDRTNATDRAERVLREREEIRRLRTRLAEKRDGDREDTPGAVPARSGDSLGDQNLEIRRDQLRRRLQSQQRLLAATREQLAFATRSGSSWPELPGRTVTPTNGEGRPLPILVEDPTVDLPSRHGASALSVLLRLSELTQVICISDDPDLARWAREIGGRVDLVRAHGWFAADRRRSC